MYYYGSGPEAVLLRTHGVWRNLAPPPPSVYAANTSGLCQPEFSTAWRQNFETNAAMAIDITTLKRHKNTVIGNPTAKLALASNFGFLSTFVPIMFIGTSLDVDLRQQ